MLANPAFSVTDERQCGASTGTDVVRGPYLRSGAGACAACSSFLDIKGPTIAGRAPLSSTIAGRAPSPPPPTCESEKPGKRPVAGNECHASQCHTRRRKQGGERIRWEGGSDPPPPSRCDCGSYWSGYSAPPRPFFGYGLFSRSFLREGNVLATTFIFKTFFSKSTSQI
jgi:hypothetical protein